jgi:transcriptional regulator with XRE-family HTH domain
MKIEGFDIELKKLGNRIRKIRKGRVWTLLDLEVATGIHDTDLSRIERGLENIEFQTIFKIALGLEVQTKELLDYDGPIPVKAAKKKKP